MSRLRKPGIRRGEWLELMPGKLPAHEEGGRMSAALLWLEEEYGLNRKWLASLEAAGGIKLAGDRLRIHGFPPKVSQYPPALEPVEVLYEDDYCLVVHKPQGIKVHSDGVSREPALSNLVSGLYSGRGELVAPEHVHRLDEHTSGPVLYAKNELARRQLETAMEEKRIGRIYVALVDGVVPASLRLIDEPIGRDRHHASRRRVSPTGKKAVTRVELVETHPASSLVRLTLETGRTHQIRVHMSYMGHPLLGDALYGGSLRYLKHQALHGESLSFPHPMTGEPVVVSDPWPAAWEGILAKLRSAE
ncbi:RluA family pseudouridine synthase [Paenibacillus antibioticophila]|uniref:RluA family pseudouridine synthase n=1 Tax=Paenibacillus antibioticophila TaxID=1274374 RepID=UPI000AE244E1|nr:RluA family pseudouridine synthase [Paenibacillus antibioticophila]